MKVGIFSFAVALASFATIALELMLTRIYSVTMYYHFAYMVISVALLGLAISGVAIYLLPRVFEERRTGVLASAFMLAFSLTSMWALKAAASNPISLAQWMENAGRLLTIYFAASLPFLFSGFALSLAIAAARENIGRIYGFDLVGAAVGCLAVIPALPLLGGPGAILMVAAAGAASALLFALSFQERSHPWVVRGLAAASGVVFLASVYLSVSESSARRFEMARNPTKFLGERPLLFEKWNALSQITVGPGENDHHWIFIDADAATRLWKGDALKASAYAAPRRFGEVRVASLVYSIRHDGTALIIGPGGGTDVVSALYYGTPKVIGVEVNPIIAESIMGKAFADYSGNLYRDPRVHVVTDEGRSFVRRSSEPYASIQATLVDTWAAAASGAFTLTENNLYTVEAFTEFLDHLRPDGVLTVTRWYDPGQPREFLRLVALAREALESRGVAPADVRRHIVLATDNERRASLLLAKAPFSDADLGKITETAAEGRLTILYVPAGRTPSARAGDRFLASFLEAASARDFLADLSYDVSPTTDDRPFFFYTVRPGDLGAVFANVGSLERNNLGIAVLLGLLGLSTVLTVVLVVLPLLLFRRDVLRESPGPKLRVLAYFLALGFGFILVELGFMQRFVLFLGHPIYALAVVLAVLLAASGTGSALSGWGCARFGLQGFVRRAVGALAIVLILYAVGLGPVFRLLIGLPLALRIVITALLVLVPGLLMGSLLPTGVRNANALGRGMVPWAWGLNGASSVVGSILAVALSMNFGFTLALLAGVVVYALGMLALPGPPSSRSAETASPESKAEEPLAELASPGVQP